MAVAILFIVLMMELQDWRIQSRPLAPWEPYT